MTMLLWEAGGLVPSIHSASYHDIYHLSIIIYRVLVPFQLVPANPSENTLSVFASDAWTAVWPESLERYYFRNWYEGARSREKRGPTLCRYRKG